MSFSAWQKRAGVLSPWASARSRLLPLNNPTSAPVSNWGGLVFCKGGEKTTFSWGCCLLPPPRIQPHVGMCCVIWMEEHRVPGGGPGTDRRSQALSAVREESLGFAFE